MRSECAALIKGSLIGSFLLAGCSSTSARMPPEGRLVVSITPGKPDAPTETVTVAWRDGNASLRSERRDAGGKILAAGEARLDESRLRGIWRTVQRNELTAFMPRESAGQTFDFGQRRVRLEWVPRAGQARRSQEFSWIKPLDNESAVAPLLRAAADAARETVPGVRLAYFPPGGPDPR